MARPTGVTILAVLSFLGAAVLLLGACVMFAVGASSISRRWLAGAEWAGRSRRSARLPA